MDRAEKAELVAELNGVFKTTNTVVVAHYAGLTVAQMQTLRRQAKQAGTSVKVAKNRLAKIALEGTDAAPIGPLLKGPTLNLDVTAGPAFQQTRYVNLTRENDVSARAGLDFSWKITDDLQFTESAAIVIGSQWTSTTALTYALTDALSSRASFDVIRENDPPLGRRAWDTATRLSLVYGF